ncbi:MAG: hypothetical protein IRY91_15040 [Gemmatimonadaceae bacterium]|nr:hypothetical protein [Gemmatimonadaceae bacterium]
MDFKTATDRLTACIGHADIAEAAGVSVQSIRQARLDPTNPSYRSPPPGWESVLARLARERSRLLKTLADALERRSP